MEQTIGKRIAQHRKRLGLTQDQLAEKLGITAQAISKWENDLSCPDISTLPQLAQIFGITTDELLGREPPKKVHKAELVADDEPEEDNGIHIQLDGGKHGLIFAICVLWVGGLTLLARIMEWDVSFWSILWPSLILFTGVGGSLRKFSVFYLACILFGGYYLVSNLGLWTLGLSGDLIFPICVVLFGSGLLIDALRAPKALKTLRNNGKKEQSRDYRVNGEEFECNLSFGENTQLVTLPRLAHGAISVSFGELTVDLSGCQEVCDGCHIDANCSFGELRLLVPRRYTVVSSNSTAFASIYFKGQPDTDADGTIHLDANASFGEITVQYI